LLDTKPALRINADSRTRWIKLRFYSSSRSYNVLWLLPAGSAVSINKYCLSLNLDYVHRKNPRAILESMQDNEINIQSTDEELMLAVQKESMTAFEILYDRYHQRLFHFSLIFIMALGIVSGSLSDGPGTIWVLNRVRVEDS
jgi:hypothetical protein